MIPTIRCPKCKQEITIDITDSDIIKFLSARLGLKTLIVSDDVAGLFE